MENALSRVEKPYAEWMLSKVVFSAKSVLIRRDKLSEEQALIEVNKRVSLIDGVVKASPPKHLAVNHRSELEIAYEQKSRFIRSDLRYAFMTDYDIRATNEYQATEQRDHEFVIGLGSYM